MDLIQEAEQIANEIALQEPNTRIESVIRRLLIELKLRDALKLKLDNISGETVLIRVKKQND